MSAHLSRLRRVEERLRRRRAAPSDADLQRVDAEVRAALDGLVAMAPDRLPAEIARLYPDADAEVLLAAVEERREFLKIAGAAGHAPTMPGEPR